jgi:DNA adenine methylase
MATDRLHAPFRYYGGKGNMVSKLLRLVPDGGKPYCEPYCGAATLFFARDPAPVEVLNDLDGDIVNVFRVLQNRQTFEELRHMVMYTPYAKAEYLRAHEIIAQGTDDPVLRAWATLVKYAQSMSGHPHSPHQWGRTFTSKRGIADCVNSWIMRITMLDAWHWRLMQVQIDSRDAIDVIRYWDTPEAVFYCDPPYLLETRQTKHQYRYETTLEHHQQLVQTLLQCQGAVVLSVYDHPVYKPLQEAGWQCLHFKTICYAAGRTRNSRLRGAGTARLHVPRIETVYRNSKAVALAPYQTDETSDTQSNRRDDEIANDLLCLPVSSVQSSQPQDEEPQP